MCQPRKWWWGLLPLAALWAVSVYVLTPQVESELVHRATVALHGEQTWVKTAIEGRDLVIEGEAPSEAARQAAKSKLDQADGIRVIVDAATALPEAKPFAWTASRAAGTVTLSGAVSPGDAREKLIAEAKRQLPGDAIVDQMKVASGAPEASPAMTATALKTLAALKSGSVALVDNTLSVKGETADVAASTAILAATRKLGAPIEVATVDLTPPPSATPQPVASAAPKGPPVERPYVWQAMREGAVMTLTGSVPSDSARTQVVAAAKSAMGSGKVNDQLKLATGLPQGIDYGAATSFALSQIASLRIGTAKLVDGKLELQGEAADAAAYRKIATATSAPLPGGVRLESSAVQPPRVAAYTWSAKRDGKTLTLAGHYPDEGTGYMMKQAVAHRFADLKLTDRTSIASGAPAGFSAAVGMALDQLSQLESGEASIASGRLTLSGVAASDKSAADVKEALTKLVGGMAAEAKLTILPPPPPPAAPPIPAAAPTPVVPPVAAAAPAASATSTAKSPPAPVAALTAPTPSGKPAASPAAQTQAQVAATSPPPSPSTTPPAAPIKPVASDLAGKQTAPAAALPPVGPAPSTTAMPATAAKPATTEGAPAKQAAASTAASGAQSTAATQAAKKGSATAAACPTDAGAKIKAGRIRFASSRTEMLPTSRKRLTRIADILQNCPSLKIEIGGHTDSTGRAAFNDALSKRRAEAVRDALVKRGIDATRLAAAGYGASKPLADNRKASGKALNRRIEFTVVQ